MDTVKVGGFLRELRKEKQLTQEQFAEVMNVSARTVSRWETGSNMPDLDILILMSEFYHVETGEILNGERKSAMKDENTNDTVMKAAEVSAETRRRLMRNMHFLFLGGAAAAAAYMIMLFTDHADNFFGGLCTGIMAGMMVVGVLITSRSADRIRCAKLRLIGKK